MSRRNDQDVDSLINKLCDVAGVADECRLAVAVDLSMPPPERDLGADAPEEFEDYFRDWIEDTRAMDIESVRVHRGIGNWQVVTVTNETNIQQLGFDSMTMSAARMWEDWARHQQGLDVPGRQDEQSRGTRVNNIAISCGSPEGLKDKLSLA